MKYNSLKTMNILYYKLIIKSYKIIIYQINIKYNITSRFIYIGIYGVYIFKQMKLN